MDIYKKSRISGKFTGWKSGKVFKLETGQYWKQTKSKYKYKYKYRPKAVIWKDGSKYFLEVEGMTDKISVRKTSLGDYIKYLEDNE